MTNKEYELILTKLEDATNAIKDIYTILGYSAISESDAKHNEKTETQHGENKIRFLRYVDNETRIINSIKRVIMELGVRCSNLGFHYITEGVLYGYNNLNRISSISVTKELYPHIAKKYDSTPCNVERSIRHEIEYVYRNGNLDKILEVYPCWNSKKDKPSNSEFIYGIVNYIDKEYAESM